MNRAVLVAIPTPLFSGQSTLVSGPHGFAAFRRNYTSLHGISRTKLGDGPDDCITFGRSFCFWEDVWWEILSDSGWPNRTKSSNKERSGTAAAKVEEGAFSIYLSIYLSSHRIASHLILEDKSENTRVTHRVGTSVLSLALSPGLFVWDGLRLWMSCWLCPRGTAATHIAERLNTPGRLLSEVPVEIDAKPVGTYQPNQDKFSVAVHTKFNCDKLTRKDVGISLCPITLLPHLCAAPD